MHESIAAAKPNTATTTSLVGTSGINVDKLAATLQSAMLADAKSLLNFISPLLINHRYQRENDAKFRAVAQRVATYDEFEAIVKGSHIKVAAPYHVQNLTSNSQ